MGSVVQLKPGTHGQTVHRGRRFIRGASGVTILDGEAEPDAGPRSHRGNLAGKMTQSERRQLADRICEYIDIDRESRADWERREEFGLALMGINELPMELADRVGDVGSPGIAQVKMPLMIEAATHFQARAIAEMFPAEGPVKTKVLGKQTAERTAQAERIRNFGNYYLTDVDKGYYADTDQMLLYLPLAGSAFRKAGINWATGLPELRYVKATNFVVPYSAVDLISAPRYTDLYPMTGQEIRRAMEAGRFHNVRLMKPSLHESRHSRTSDVSDGRTASEHEDDALYDIAECHIWLELEVDRFGKPGKDELNQGGWKLLPYVVVVERSNREVLLIQRNWEKGDKTCKKIEWFTHHKFFPGLGFYGWGYTHVVGSLAKATNDSVNALLDGAYASNFQGGFITKEGRAAGMAGEIELEHGKWKVIEGTYEELQKALYTPPFKEPSPALAKLTEMLVESFRRFGSTTEAAVGDANNLGPVGTTIALIEQSNVVPTAIHKRLHVSFGHELQMWARLVYLYMPNRYDYEQSEEERFLLRKDFDGTVDIIPVSDPNISSQTQRIAMCQGVLQLQTEAPDLYTPPKRVEAHRRMLAAMRVPDIDAVAPEVRSPKYLDPIAEFQMVMAGNPVKAFETQDHAAHLAAHTNQRGFLMGMVNFTMMAPDRQQLILSALDAHEADHLALMYRKQVMDAAGIPLPPPGDDGEPAELEPELEYKITSTVVGMLPPPPPPVEKPGGDDGMIAKTQAAIQAKQMEAEAAIQRETKAFMSEEERKKRAFDAEELRKSEAAARDNKRKDEATEAEIIRGTKKAVLDIKKGEAVAGQQLTAKERAAQQQLQHKDAGTRQQLAHKEAGTGQQLRHKEAGAGQQLRHKDAGAKQQLTHKEQQAQQALKQKDAGAGQDREIKGKSAAQERRLTDSKAKQEQKLTEQSHQQGSRHTEEQHQQAVKILEEDHEIDASHREDDHKRESKMAEQSGKLKLQQTKQQLQAKKQAAAKKKTAKKKAA